jgi:hypothetical protein
MNEWSIDWVWFDEMVREHEQLIEKNKELLIDFEDTENVTKCSTPSTTPKSTYITDLESIFNHHN